MQSTETLGEKPTLFSEESYFATHCLFWRFSCPLLPQFPCLIYEAITKGSWEKDWEIDATVQEYKLGYQREGTDDAARWNCSLCSRSWEQLLLSLKVIAQTPARPGSDGKLKPVVFVWGGPYPFLAVICLPFNIIRQTRLVFSLVLTTAN